MKITQKNKEQGQKGFTIIEVLIVLAIAGLIMLIVFLAVPALQRNSRTTRLKADASKAASLMQEVINNNNGTVPTAVPPAIGTAQAQYAQVTNVNYGTASPMGALPAPLVPDTIYIRQFSTCANGSGGQVSTTGGTSRQVTVTYLVESPGTPAAAAGAGGAVAAGANPANFVAQCIPVQ